MAIDTARRNTGLLNHESLWGRHRNRPTRLPGEIHRERRCTLQIEPENCSFARPEVVEREISFLLIFLVPAIVFRLDVVEAIEAARRNFRSAASWVRHEEKNHLVQIRQALVLLVDRNSVDCGRAPFFHQVHTGRPAKGRRDEPDPAASQHCRQRERPFLKGLSMCGKSTSRPDIKHQATRRSASGVFMTIV